MSVSSEYGFDTSKAPDIRFLPSTCKSILTESKQSSSTGFPNRRNVLFPGRGTTMLLKSPTPHPGVCIVTLPANSPNAPMKIEHSSVCRLDIDVLSPFQFPITGKMSRPAEAEVAQKRTIKIVAIRIFFMFLLLLVGEWKTFSVG